MNRILVAPLYSFYSDLRDPLPDTFDLNGGYKIKKLDKTLLEPAFDFFHASFSEHDKDDLRKCTYAIYYEFKSAEDNISLPQEFVIDIHRITQSLRVIKRTRVLPAILLLRKTANKQLSEIDALYFQHKPSLEISFIDTDKDMEHFKSQDVDEIQRYWADIKKLWDAKGGSYHRVLNALIFYEIGHRTIDYKPRLINLVTALESLFNTSKDQITYMIRIRCSYFLEHDPKKRIELSLLLKEIYDLRSMFVHGQPTPNKLSKDERKQKKLLMDTEDIIRSCIRKIFDKKLLSLFGDDNLLKQEFANLEFGAKSLLD